MEQNIITLNSEFSELDNLFEKLNIKTLMLVCGRSFDRLNIKNYFDTLTERPGVKIIRFSDFKPNPLYESVVEGVRIFNENACDAVFAIGGGSGMDVAKCIKMFANMSDNEDYVLQDIVPNDIPLIAMPTTAGSGSEATKYAIIYYKGEKLTVTHESCIPSMVIMDPSVLETLPLYHKKSTMLDALCHAIESYWSVKSTERSREYAEKAITEVLKYKASYLANEPEGNEKMLWAAFTAGEAINITGTTAGHAMCYKLTGLYNFAHGHAAALGVSKLWHYTVEHTDTCIDPRGEAYVCGMLKELSTLFGCESAEQGAEKFQKLLDSLDLPKPKAGENDIEILTKSVDPAKLKSNPVSLNENVIKELYKSIIG
ncbi:MAG: phosphonoacetaldehyde reductase [Eubacterium sp.]|nr:phosphonoacetaldehyde reductase [Eubacterium sp.]